MNGRFINSPTTNSGFPSDALTIQRRGASLQSSACCDAPTRTACSISKSERSIAVASHREARQVGQIEAREAGTTGDEFLDDIIGDMDTRPQRKHLNIPLRG